MVISIAFTIAQYQHYILKEQQQNQICKATLNKSTSQTLHRCNALWVERGRGSLAEWLMSLTSGHFDPYRLMFVSHLRWGYLVGGVGVQGVGVQWYSCHHCHCWRCCNSGVISKHDLCLYNYDWRCSELQLL